MGGFLRGDGKFGLNDPDIVLNAVTATGASAANDMRGGLPLALFQVKSTGTATFKVQGTLVEVPDLEGPAGAKKASTSDADWYDIETLNMTVGTDFVLVDEPHRWLRANITSYTSGAHTVYVSEGNVR